MLSQFELQNNEIDPVEALIHAYDNRQYRKFLYGLRYLPEHRLTEGLYNLASKLTKHRDKKIREEAKETLFDIGYF